MADGKQCDRCKEWDIVKDGSLLPDDWEERVLLLGGHGLVGSLARTGQGHKLDLCPPCAREFQGAMAMANEARIKEFVERFWPK